MKCIDKKCDSRRLNGGDDISDFYYCKKYGISCERGMDECLEDKWEKEETMIRASRNGNLSKENLFETFKNNGLIGVYNLGLENMFDYLKGENNGVPR